MTNPGSCTKMDKKALVEKEVNCLDSKLCERFVIEDTTLMYCYHDIYCIATGLNESMKISTVTILHTIL